MSDHYPSPDKDLSTSASRARLGAALSSMVDRYGPALFYEPDRLKLYLDQACPDAPRDISLVLMALTEQVPQQLLAAHSDLDAKTLPSRLVQRLVERAAFDRASAAWVVRAWTHALALPATGLGGDAPVTHAVPPTAVDFAAVVTPWAHSETAAPHVRTATTNAGSKDGTPGDARDRSVGAPPQPIEANRVEATAEPIMRVDDDAVDQQAKPESPIEAPFEPAWRETVRSDAVEESKPEAPVDVVVAGTETDGVEPPGADLPPVGEVVAEESSGRSASVDESEPRPIVLPESAVRDEPEPHLQASGRGSLARPRYRSLGIAASLIAIVIVIAFMAGRSTTRLPSPAGEAPASARIEPSTPTAPPGEAARSTASAPASPSTQPAPVDANPATASTATNTASEAKPSEPTVPNIDTPKQSEPPNALAANAPSTADAQQPAPSSPSSSPGVDTQRPEPSPPSSSAGVDAPAPPSESQPTVPAIARIDVPRVVVGKPFVIAIGLDPASSTDIVSIEREVLESTARWPEQVKVTAASSLSRSRTGALLYPVAAMGRPSRSTLQFTIIDSRGERSAPTRVAFRAVPAAGRPGSVECPRATTCGSVVAVRELDARAGGAGRTGEFATPAYEVVIRMDDRSVNRVIQGVPWRAGTRVRKFGSQFVQIKADNR